MKIATCGALALVASFVLPACGGSQFDEYANDVCKCKDEKCMEEVQNKYKDKMKSMENPADLAKLSEADQKAIAKAMACALEAAGFGKSH